MSAVCPWCGDGVMQRETCYRCDGRGVNEMGEECYKCGGLGESLPRCNACGGSEESCRHERRNQD